MFPLIYADFNVICKEDMIVRTIEILGSVGEKYVLHREFESAQYMIRSFTATEAVNLVNRGRNSHEGEF